MRLSFLAILAVLASCNGGCSATEETKQVALLPAMRLAWATIGQQAGASLAALPASGQSELTAAISGMNAQLEAPKPNAVAMLGYWPSIRIAAEMEIERRLTAQEIGPRVSLSLAQRLIQFESALNRYQQ